MAYCRACEKKLPFFTVINARYASPFGDGPLCAACYLPYRLVLDNYTSNMKKADTDPKAAARVALCCLLAAQRVNLVRTTTAALVGLVETEYSWQVCRQTTVDLTTRAMSMLSSDNGGLVFFKGVRDRAIRLTEAPSREITIQRYASVMGDAIRDIEYEALERSGATIDDLNNLVASLPGHLWLLGQ